jgi:hypothetical protein
MQRRRRDPSEPEAERDERAAAACKTWGRLDRARRDALVARFDKFGFLKAEPRLEDTQPVMTWLDDQWAQVLQALGRIPDAALAAVPDIRWGARSRGQGSDGRRRPLRLGHQGLPHALPQAGLDRAPRTSVRE